jgi:hypothetical protein
MKYCARCKVEKPFDHFYRRRRKSGYSAYCKPCMIAQSSERQKKLKLLAVEYKGGVCEKCGYNRCIAALEFHHTDPKEKDFILSGVKSYVFNERIQKELDKCQILCSNCHRETHYKE